MSEQIQIRADLIAGVAEKHDIGRLAEAALFGCATALDVEKVQRLENDALAAGDIGLSLACRDLLTYAE